MTERFEVRCAIRTPKLICSCGSREEAEEKAVEIEKEWRAEAARLKLNNYYFYPLNIVEVKDEP